MLTGEMKYPLIPDSIKKDASILNKRKRTQVYVDRHISMSLKSTKATLQSHLNTIHNIDHEAIKKERQVNDLMKK